VGDVERRIEALERAYGADPGPYPERERLLSEIRQLEAAGRAKAAAEEAAGDPKRRMALAELEAWVRARRGA
jgi:hypothetical protein